MKYFFYTPLVHMGIVKSAEDFQKNFLILEGILKESIRVSTNTGAVFYVVILAHWESEYDPLQQRFTSKIEEICNKNDIKYLVPIRNTKDLYYTNEGGHLNREGAKLFAQKIKEWLMI